MHNRFIHRWIISIVLLLYVGIQSYCLQQLTVNYDEGLFAYYGATILKGQGNKDIVKFDSKLPVTALNMLPRAVEQLLHPGLSRPDDHIDIIRGRYISLLAAVMLALLIYHWSSLLYGKRAGIFSFILFIICPNFLAHGVFVSSDIFACLFMTGCFYFLWRFRALQDIKYFILASILTGIAQITKFSMLHLLILFPVLLINGCSTGSHRCSKGRLIKLLFVFAGINWFIICAGHLFYGMFVPLNNYRFQSSAFQQLQLVLSGAGNWLPVPFPSSYIKSMDVVMYFDRLGGGMPNSLNGPSYILGQSSGKGFWYYYFVALLYKLPLPVLVILFSAAVLYFRKSNYPGFWQKEIYLFVPVFYFLIYLDFFYSTQLGIRHIMIILPLLYIFAGYFFKLADTKWRMYTVYAPVAWQLVSVAMYFPHFLPYTNEFVADKKMAYTKIADTNICYGEGGKYLAEYLGSHPGAYYLPASITAGKIVMEVNEMLNLNIRTMGRFDWVKGLTPYDHIHSQYLIFDVSRQQADSLKKIYF